MVTFITDVTTFPAGSRVGVIMLDEASALLMVTSSCGEGGGRHRR
jgi:hypothetical protein